MNNKELLILDLLKSSGKLSIGDGIKILNTSESTVRRLFIKLENEGKAIRTIGGIQAISENDINYHYDKLDSEKINEKILIGKYAAELVEDNDIIFLDSGTTVSRMCIELSKRIKSKTLNGDSIIVFTNSLVNFNILQNDIKLNLIGGEYRINRKDFCGYIAEEIIKSLHFKKCFLGTDGYTFMNGFMTTDFHTTSMAKAVVERSDIKYVLADYSKFNRNSMVSYARLSDIDYIITDKSSDELITICNQSGLKILS